MESPLSTIVAEIEATVLVASITDFPARKAEFAPTQAQAYVRSFLDWVAAEALDGREGIVDGYVGDKVIVAYAATLGSDEPFVDAIQAAIALIHHDFLSFRPQIGIASGRIAVREATTAFGSSVSVSGLPVTLAEDCALVQPDTAKSVPSAIVTPAREWDHLDSASLEALLDVDGGEFDVRDCRFVPIGPGGLEVREIRPTDVRLTGTSAEDRVVAVLKFLQDSGRHWPRRQP